MKDLKYILKRILIGVGIILVMSFINKCDVNAAYNGYDIYVNNSLVTTSTKKYVGANQNVTLQIRNKSTALVNNASPTYGYVALCSSSAGADDTRYINTASSSNLTNINVVNSTVGCTIPGTNAYIRYARVVYFTFEIPMARWDCGATGTNCTFTSYPTFQWYQNGSNEYTLISYSLANSSFNFNDTVNSQVYQNDQIISQNQTIIDKNNQQINQNQTIINQNTQINDNIQENTDTMNDDTVDSPLSKINESKSKVASNSTISSLVTLPITLFTNVLSGLNSSCSTFNLGTLFGHNLVFNCIDIGGVLGSVLWNTIDILISGLLVYAISKKFIKLFNELSQLKEGDIID